MFSGPVHLNVDTDILTARAAAFDNTAQQFFAAHRRMLGLAGDMTGIWEGKDQEMFAKALNSFTPVLNDLSKLLLDYADFLRYCATEYEKTDGEIRGKISAI